MIAAGVPPDVQAQLQAGKLETTCPDCGRWSAAVWRCSWCFRELSPADWYRNGDQAERAARMPTTAPANPPNEYRDSAAWPAHWGPYPGKTRPKVPREAWTPVNPSPEPEPVTLPVWPVIAAHLARSAPGRQMLSSCPRVVSQLAWGSDGCHG